MQDFQYNFIGKKQIKTFTQLYIPSLPQITSIPIVLERKVNGEIGRTIQV